LTEVIRKREIQAIIFDLDGVMVDSEPLARQAWQALLAEHGHQLDQETFDAMLGLRLADSSRLVKERFGLAMSIDEIVALRGQLLLDLVPGNLRPMPGLYALLNAVEALGLRKAVATSSPSGYAPVALHEVGIADRFDVIITGDTVAHGKPAPDIYLGACRALRLSPAVCAAIEDSPNGVKAAKAAGMMCIAVPNAQSLGLEFPQPDAVYPSLSALAEDLVDWLAKPQSLDVDSSRAETD
jgi:HAD superfamily hydrolase (TIGR01509 family)